jgi:hypothetical protein
LKDRAVVEAVLAEALDVPPLGRGRRDREPPGVVEHGPLAGR